MVGTLLNGKNIPGGKVKLGYRLPRNIYLHRILIRCQVSGKGVAYDHKSTYEDRQ